jgi:two-component system sensor histidine kinase PilS (NtrC family)
MVHGTSISKRAAEHADGPGRSAVPPEAAAADESARGVEVQRERTGGSRLGGFARSHDLLRWVYLARLSLAGGVFAAAVFTWSKASTEQTLAASLALVVTLLVTPAAYWFTHVREEQPGPGFLNSQAVLDVVLVTLVVHLTGGGESVAAPLYILVISAYTLLLPQRGWLLVTLLACVAYITDVIWGQGTTMDLAIALQLLVFASVAVVVGKISTKLRETGAELTSVEHALEQLRLETGDILGNIPTALMTLDGEGRLVYANPAAERLLGLDGMIWLDRPVMDKLRSRSEGLYRVLERTLKHGMPVASAEIEVVRGTGSVPVGVSTAVLERAEGLRSVTAIMRDISDIKVMEELRRRTERLEAVAELSASLAHEIKNPLASISSSVQQLSLRAEADEDDRLLSKLILKESDRLSHLLSDFIDFARVHIERSKELDLREIARHAVEVVRRHPAYRSEIEIELDADARPVVIDGDEDLLHRVAMNLVLNAVQVAVPGRRTNIRVEVHAGAGDCTVRGIEIPDPVMLRVSDDGLGIEEADLKRVFDPFFSRRRGGSGLGLAIVHRVVREHRGTVFVASSPEHGTHFTICLPGRTASEGGGPEESQQ